MKKLDYIIIILMLLAVGSTLASDKIKIKLHQPPPNKLGASDLWKLDITNTTNEDITIYLTGTATEEKDGLIVDGKSNVFTIKPGKKTYGYNDFKDGEVNWKDKTYQEAILRTGNVKSGTYTVCVTAYFENGSVADNETCITQVIENKSTAMILPVSPADKEEIEPDTLPGLMFLWKGIGTDGPYDLIIVEIKGSQSQDDAIKENRPFYEQKGIKGSSFQYPVTGPKFEAGKKYAWKIWSDDITSEINTIYIKAKLNKQPCIRITLGNVVCKKFPANQYTFKIVADNINSLGTGPISVSVTCLNSAITLTGASPVTLNPQTSALIKGTLSGSTNEQVCLKIRSTKGCDTIICFSLPDCNDLNKIKPKKDDGVLKQIQPSCDCGEWSNNIITYTYTGGGIGSVRFGGSVNLLPGITYTLTPPVYNCNPASSECQQTYNWKKDGIQQGITINPFSNYYGGFSQGIHVITITPRCGDNSCPPVEFTVGNADCPNFKASPHSIICHNNSIYNYDFQIAVDNNESLQGNISLTAMTPGMIINSYTSTTANPNSTAIVSGNVTGSTMSICFNVNFSTVNGRSCDTIICFTVPECSLNNQDTSQICTEFSIGQHYGGGIIFYIDNTCQHGLIAATSDQAAGYYGGVTWFNGSNYLTNATGSAIGTGQANTTAIVAIQGTGNYAAYICDQLVLNGYSDWFLPSKDELRILFLNQDFVGGFMGYYDYWSSTEYNFSQAYQQHFPPTGYIPPNGQMTPFVKYIQNNVRAIRAF